jgi:hypothetical protein
MKLAICTNCGRGMNVSRLKYDENNLDGFCATCISCGSEFELEFDISDTFITDIAKMADFKILTKEEFLSSYSYMTEYEYDATKLYLKWLRNER